MQTAVEWFIENINKNIPPLFFPKEIADQAKKMFEQQIIDAYQAGDGDAYNLKETEVWAEQYYNETYGSKGSDEEEQKKLITEIMNEDSKDGSYTEINWGGIIQRIPIDSSAFLEGYEQINQDNPVTRGSTALVKVSKPTSPEPSDDTLNFVKWIAANWIPLHVTKEYLWEYDELDISKIPQNYRGYKTEKQLYSLYLEHLKTKS